MPSYSDLLKQSALGSGTDYLEAQFQTWESEATDRKKNVWDSYFSNLGEGAVDQTAPAAQTSLKQAAVTDLINSYRMRGHELAEIDPLNIREKRPVIELSLKGHGLTEQDLTKHFNGGVLTQNKNNSLQEIRSLLEKYYCGTIGIEYMHIAGTTKKEWLRNRIESDQFAKVQSTDEKITLLQQVSAAEGLEKHLHTQYVGQKRFSLEGGESLIPCLSAVIERCSRDKVDEAVIGMAHRGRLNVLVNIFGKLPSDLFQEFEGLKKHQLLAGDVKYHQGFSSDFIFKNKHHLHLTLAFNPSHLEIVAPVVIGSVKARQDRRRDRNGEQVLPITIHGDAAFAGQGVVMETLNMANSRGYTTRGSIRIVINNQIGFTTSNTFDARSTPYCTDVAKMLNIPIFHVNGDDPEAVVFATRLAFDYRQEFHEDVIIDLVCYRRHGHNEADEPAVTQPNMYRIIRSLPSVRKLYANQLVSANLITEQDAKKTLDDYRKELKAGNCVVPDITHQKITNQFMVDWQPYLSDVGALDTEVDTTTDLKNLQKLGEHLSAVPEGFTIHSRAQNILKQRLEMSKGERPVDWGFAENVAYATLINDGFSIRVTGQDVRRGTFFHRHASYHNTETRKAYTPLQKIKENQPSFTIIDSMLSEEAVLAFEYGYASSSPETLVVWEAQFGDFANTAQVVIDQFISSGEAKWGRYCGLVMLLPHGFEGQGPEHSSARLERFFQLCAQGNLQLTVPSEPKQIYHLIRRQMLMKIRKPLIVMSPKSLLRLPEASNSLDELANGSFQTVIDDAHVKQKNKIKHVIFCSGKIYYELRTQLTEHKLDTFAIIRLEQCYPFPYRIILSVLKGYRKAETIRWCQEEPKNQGAWRSIHHRFNRVLDKISFKSPNIIYHGRPSASSPAVGDNMIHRQQQDDLIKEALDLKPTDIGNPRWRQALEG